MCALHLKDDHCTQCTSVEHISNRTIKKKCDALLVKQFHRLSSTRRVYFFSATNKIWSHPPPSSGIYNNNNLISFSLVLFALSTLTRINAYTNLYQKWSYILDLADQLQQTILFSSFIIFINSYHQVCQAQL